MPFKQSNVDGDSGSNGYAPIINSSEKLIPEDGEEWTDFKNSDPGQTILSGILGRFIRLFHSIFSGNQLPSNLKPPSTKRTKKQKTDG